jgi:cytochrome c-type biogenesis protein CcsB
MSDMNLSESTFFNIAYLCFLVSAIAYVVHLLRPDRGIGWVATGVSAVGLVLLTLGLGMRTVRARHWPLANTYEFSLVFLWSIVSVYLLLERAMALRQPFDTPAATQDKAQDMDTRAGGAFILPIACLVGTYAWVLTPASAQTPQPLLPALRSIWLLLHTVTAAVGYGGFTAACGAGIMYLIKDMDFRFADRLPSLQELDAYNYRAVAFGYPWMSLAIIMGAIWAQVAWGNYWNWDIKETWALMAWLVYTLFFHTRVTRGWRGRRTAIISIVGFLFVLFTFLGVGWLAQQVGLESLHVY